VPALSGRSGGAGATDPSVGPGSRSTGLEVGASATGTSCSLAENPVYGA
jgi:hypothetical protein